MDKNSNYENVAYMDEGKANRLVEFLNYSGIKNVTCLFNEVSNLYDVSVPTKDYEMAKSLCEAFEYNEENEPSTDISDVNLYTSSTEKYKDNMSTAITFFICGGVGLFILLLNDIGVFKFIVAGSASFILSNIVLALVFLIFIAIGIGSLKYSKKVKAQVDLENEAKEEVLEWLRDNVTCEAIEGSYDNSIPEEMKYFNRSEYLKEIISKEFKDITDEKIIDILCDAYLEELFN